VGLKFVAWRREQRFRHSARDVHALVRGIILMANEADNMAKTATEAGQNALGAAQQVAQQMTTEFSKMFSQMKMPGTPDMDALLAAHRRNIETLTQANRVAMEGAQAVARRHMEIMQQGMAEMTETVRALASAEAPQARAAKQAEMLKASYERAVANMRELSDMIQNASGEAVGLLNKRFTEAMDEVKVLIEKSQRNT
jgi:phasin family protein